MTTNRRVEEHYDFKRVGELLSVSVSTVRRLVRTGRISPVRVISRQVVRVPESAVNRFMEARTV